MTEYRVTPLGYRQQYPLPSDDELQLFYAEKYFQQPAGQYADPYSDDELAWFDLNAAIAAKIATSAGLPAGRLLDVGCGEGFFMSGMHKRCWSVRGYDFSSYGIERHNPDLMAFFEQGSLYQLLKADDEHYDFVNLGNVLEHVPAPEDLLSTIASKMSAGGMLRVNVPNDFSAIQERLLESGTVSQPYWIAPFEHLNYFSQDSLRALLVHSGWEITRVLADFPIEHFLLHPDANYVEDKSRGKAAHRARVWLDLHYSGDLDAFIDLLAAQARCGMGRSIIAFAQPAAALR